MIRLLKYLFHYLAIATTLVIVVQSCNSNNDSNISKDILTKDEREWLHDHPDISIGPDPFYAPIEFINADGVYDGYSADFIGEIEKLLDYKFKVVKVNSWSDVVERMRNKEIDITPSAVQNDYRRQFMVFSEPWVEIPLVIVSSTNSNHDTYNLDIKKSRIAVTKNYALEQEIRNQYPEAKIITTQNDRSSLWLVSTGNADYTITNLALLSHEEKTGKITNLKISGSFGQSDVLQIGIRQDYQILKGILNKAIATISESKMNAYWSKWIRYNRNNERNYNILIYLLSFVLLIILSALIVQLLQNRKAHKENLELKKNFDEANEIIAELRERLTNIGKQIDTSVATKTLELNRHLEHLREEIDQRKQNEQYLKTTQEDLVKKLEIQKEITAMKTKFVSMISHEYKTPLSVIMSSVSLMEIFFSKGDFNGYKKQSDRVLDSVKFMTKLLDEVLSYGKNEKGIFENNTQLTNLPALTNKILTDVKRITNAARVVNVDINISQDEIILAKDLYSHIVQNLLTNAIKYSPNNSAVFIKISEKNNQLTIIVTDHGIGIPKAEQENLFKPFYRFSNVEGIKGTGLGLSIIKQCVDAMGGTIIIDSEENFGTVATVTLPIKYSVKI